MNAFNSGSFWIVMFAAGLATYLTRLSSILVVGEKGMPPLITRALRFVPPAVLTAIIIPEIFIPGGSIDLGWTNARALAALLAALVAWKTRNTLLTILVGMFALWIFRFLLAAV